MAVILITVVCNDHLQWCALIWGICAYFKHFDEECGTKCVKSITKLEKTNMFVPLCVCLTFVSVNRTVMNSSQWHTSIQQNSIKERERKGRSSRKWVYRCQRGSQERQSPSLTNSTMLYQACSLTLQKNLQLCETFSSANGSKALSMRASTQVH